MAVHLSRHNNNSAAVTILNHILEHLLSRVPRLLLIYCTYVWIGVRYCSVNASAGAFINRTQRSGRRLGFCRPYQKAAAKQRKRRYGCASLRRQSPSKLSRNPLPVPDFLPASPSPSLISDAALALKNFTAVCNGRAPGPPPLFSHPR